MVYAEPTAPDRLDAVFAALAHPMRRELVIALAARPHPPRMADLASERGMSPQLLNKHAAALERAGLARRTGDGGARFLKLDLQALADAQRWMSSAQTFWHRNLDALGAYIDTITEERNA